MITKDKLKLIIANGAELPPRPWGYKLEENTGNAFLTDGTGFELRFNGKTAKYVIDCINRFDELAKIVINNDTL